MRVTKTNPTLGQQKNKTNDFLRRFFYESPFFCDRNIALSNLLYAELPDDSYAFLRTNAAALRVLQYHLTHATFEQAQTIQGKGTIAVDLAEARWLSRDAMAAHLKLKPEAVRHAERQLLRRKIIVSETLQDGWTCRRLWALSKGAMMWLSLGAALPESKKSNDNAGGKLYHPEVVNFTPKNKPCKNKPIPPPDFNDDDVEYLDDAPKSPGHTGTSSSSLNNCLTISRKEHAMGQRQEDPTYTQAGYLTDHTPTRGYRPLGEMNAAWRKAVLTSGYPACEGFLHLMRDRGAVWSWSHKSEKRLLDNVAAYAYGYPTDGA